MAEGAHKYTSHTNNVFYIAYPLPGMVYLCAHFVCVLPARCIGSLLLVGDDAVQIGDRGLETGYGAAMFVCLPAMFVLGYSQRLLQFCDAGATFDRLAQKTIPVLGQSLDSFFE